MVNIVLATCVALTGAYIFIKVSAWRKNYKLAQTTGLPTFYSPVHIGDNWWLMLYPLLAPFANLLPRGLRLPWLPLSQVWNIWKFGYQPFQEVGSDTLLLATPKKNMLWTCDPAMIKQLLSLHTVQTPLDMVKFFDLWGPTIGSVEGEEWKNHRKIVTYGVNPSALPAVWKETIKQTDALIKRWARDDFVVPVLRHYASRLTLHVISSVFFDRKIDWAEYDSQYSTGDFHFTFESALCTVIKRLGLIFMVPRPLLRLLPFKAFQEASTAFTDWTRYMKGLRAEALGRIDEVALKPRRNILESIVVAGSDRASQVGSRPLSEGSVLGNIWFALMAGHETSASTITFTAFLLAVFPEHQIEVQRELDRQLGNRPMSEWTSEVDYQVLNKGYLGAVLKEALRLYNPAQFLMRQTIAPTAMTDSKGEAHLVPSNTTCLVAFSATFQHPFTWTPRDVPPGRRAELHHSPAIDFDPTRFVKAPEDPEVYFPFGYGSRHCPGKPFAQVEMVAFFATLLKDYSLELIIDDEVLKACEGDKKLAWQKTQDKTIRQLKDDVGSNISLAMVKELPLRIVKRNN